MILLPVHIVVWLLRLAAGVPLWLLGFPVVLGLSLAGAWEPRKSRFYAFGDGSPRIVAQWPRWAFIWNDEEVGVAGTREWMQGRPAWLRAFVWSAWRNPVNGLRFIWPFGIRIESARVRFVGNVKDSPIDDERAEIEFLRRVDGDELEAARFRWSYAWQGPYAGVWVRRPGRYPRLRCVGRWWQVWTWRVRREFAVLNFRCGYKILPRDARGIPAYDYRAPGAGFGFQVQLRGVGK